MLLLVASVVPASTAAQGLGGAAARERERLKQREAQAGAQKVITADELGSGAARVTWKAPDGSFQIAFPGVPETKQGEGGGTTYRMVSGPTLFSASVRDLTVVEVSRALDDYKAAALRYLKDTSLVSEGPATSGITNGRELVVSFARSSGGRGVMRTRAFVSGSRLYSVLVMVEPGHENDAEVLAFHDSFRLLK